MYRLPGRRGGDRMNLNVCLDDVSRIYSAARKSQTFILSQTAGYSAGFRPVSESWNSARYIKFSQQQPCGEIFTVNEFLYVCPAAG